MRVPIMAALLTLPLFLIQSSALISSVSLTRHAKGRGHTARNAIEVVDPSSNLQTALAVLGTLAAAACSLPPNRPTVSKLPPLLSACLFAFLSVYVHDRSEAVQYQFTDTSFQVARRDGSEMNLNPLFGTPYTYTLDFMGSWTFLPSAQLPVFLYITEGDCPPDRRIDPPIIVVDLAAPPSEGDADAHGAGPSASRPTAGQVHLFPLIASPEGLRRGLAARGVPEMARPRVSLQTDGAKLLRGLQLL